VSRDRYAYSEEGVGWPKVNDAQREVLAGAEIGGNKGSPPDASRKPVESESLTIPAEMVNDLVTQALRTEVGNAIWRGFVAAHGYPSWITEGTWAIDAQGGTVRWAPPPTPPPPAQGRPASLNGRT
jgi:hypothetical protein